MLNGNVPVMESQQIQNPILRPSQTDHYNRILECLQRFYFYIDGSEPGTGKTHVTCKIARDSGLTMVVLCPSTAKVTWIDAFRDYSMAYWNLPVTGGIITYETFRSTKGSQPKHGLLSRTDVGGTPMFFPTPLLAQLVQAGTLFVIDECQKVKNNNVAHKALKALIQYIYTGGGQSTTRSRVALLSGTVLDKEEQASHFMRMVGFIESRNLYSKVNGEVRLEGLAELQTWARRVNPTGADDFIRMTPVPTNRAGSTSYAFQLFRRIIRPHVMSIMPKVVPRGEDGRPTRTLNIKNGFYLMEPEDTRAYEEAIGDLAGAVRFNRQTGEVDQSRGSIGAVTNALTAIQRSRDQSDDSTSESRSPGNISG